jgi:type VI secretion system protein ImpC
MARSFSFGRIELVASTEEVGDPAEQVHETSFRIAVLGDFSGRANRGLLEGGPGLSSRRPFQIDRDDFDRVMDDLGVELHLLVPGGGDEQIVLRFRELEDFHPDRIYGRAEVFGALRDLRRRLNDPSTFRATVREMGIGPGEVSGPGPGGTDLGVGHPAADVPAPPPEDLLERVLAETRGRDAPSEPVRESGPWAAFVDRITAPYRVEAADPRQAELVAGVDAATGQLMRDILHHPDFRALEAAWRSLHFLVRRLETDGQLTVSVLDVTGAELAGDLDQAAGPRPTGVDQALIGPDDAPWAVLIGDMTFGPDPSDVRLLEQMAGLARRAGAPLLAAGDPRILGTDSLAAAPDPEDWRPGEGDPAGRRDWEALRRHPDAVYLGLCLPRYLLRLPYSRAEAPVESFDFEELTPDVGHEGYLWGNPAFLLAELLGRSFSRSGGAMRPGEINEVEGLPLHISRRDGEAHALPCAEVLLSERAAETILACGLMPVLSLRDQDVVRLVRFQSIADPSAPLAGRWRP